MGLFSARGSVCVCVCLSSEGVSLFSSLWCVETIFLRMWRLCFCQDTPLFFSSQKWGFFSKSSSEEVQYPGGIGMCLPFSARVVCWWPGGCRQRVCGVYQVARCVFAVSCRSRDRALLSVPKRQMRFWAGPCRPASGLSVCPWARDGRCSRSRRVKHMVTISKKWEHITEAKKRQDAQVRSGQLKKHCDLSFLACRSSGIPRLGLLLWVTQTCLSVSDILRMQRGVRPPPPRTNRTQS